MSKTHEEVKNQEVNREQKVEEEKESKLIREEPNKLPSSRSSSPESTSSNKHEVSELRGQQDNKRPPLPTPVTAQDVVSSWSKAPSQDVSEERTLRIDLEGGNISTSGDGAGGRQVFAGEKPNHQSNTMSNQVVSSGNQVEANSIATTATTSVTNEPNSFCIELAHLGCQRSVSRAGGDPSYCGGRESELDCCNQQQQQQQYDACGRLEVPGLLSTTKERLIMKNFNIEVRAMMDVEQFVHQAQILLNVTLVSVEEIIETMLKKALASEKDPASALEEARGALFIQDSSMLVARTIQGVRVVKFQGHTEEEDRGQLEYDQSWLCALCNLALINSRHMIIARFKQPINMGESAHEISLFMLILTPNKEKGTKCALETGRTFATMFSDKEFKNRLLRARNEIEFKSLMMLRAHQLSAGKSLKNRHKYKLDPAVQLSISSSVSNVSSLIHKKANSLSPLHAKLTQNTSNLTEVNNHNNNNNKTNMDDDDENDELSTSERDIVFNKNPRASKLFELIAQASVDNTITGEFGTTLDNQLGVCDEKDDEKKHQNQTGSCFGSVCSHIEFGKGLWDDLRRRSKYYFSDYKDAFVGPPKTIQKTVATIWFLYFGILLPTIAFSVLNRLQTHGFMGDLRKAIIGQALGGLGFALLGGQPLVIIMTTAPLCLYTKVIHQMCLDYGFPFPAMYAAVGLWNGLFLAIYSLFGFSKLMKWCTRSTEEIFALFIVIAFITDAGKELVKSFNKFYFSDQCQLLDDLIVNAGEGAANKSELLLINGTSTMNTIPVCRRETSLLFLILMFGTLWLATTLYRFNKTPFLPAAKRELLADYALPTAVIVMSFIGSSFFDDIYVEKFHKLDDLSFVRAPIEELSLAGILTAGGLGFTLSLLFFMDQNISAAMVNAPQNRLKKGCAYHLDLLVVGILNGVLTLFGLPMMHGVLPHSPLHVRSLADIEERVEEGHLREIIANVRETRVTALVSHLFLFLTLLLIPYPIAYIPTAVLNGLFLYMAVTSLDGLQVFERILLLFTEQSKYPPNHYIRRCPQRKIHKFTLLQLLQLAVMCLFGFSTYNTIEMFFPVIILLMIPFRHKIVPKFIEQKYLETLDGKH